MSAPAFAPHTYCSTTPLPQKHTQPCPKAQHVGRGDNLPTRIGAEPSTMPSVLAEPLLPTRWRSMFQRAPQGAVEGHTSNALNPHFNLHVINHCWGVCQHKHAEAPLTTSVHSHSSSRWMDENEQVRSSAPAICPAFICVVATGSGASPSPPDRPLCTEASPGSRWTRVQVNAQVMRSRVQCV